MRKIIHIDMDAFYASVEQRDDPSLRGKPVIVGGSPEGRGGVVATASYEARKFGVRSAMPSRRALELCAHGIFIKPRFEAYKEASLAIRNIFERYTDLIEPLSLDEAFLDVTNDKQGIGSAITIAENIRSAIREEVGLTASAGVSVNKFVAKIASDMKKPDGLTFIGPSRIESFLETLPVYKFFGVGKVTAARMKELGIENGGDLKKFSRAELLQHFGKTGGFFYEIVRGIDDRAVQPNRETKSVGAEDTFPVDLYSAGDLNAQLQMIGTNVHKRLMKHGLKGRTITLKVKFSDFKVITRSRSFELPVQEYELIVSTATDLLSGVLPTEKGIRLLGVSLSNFGSREPRANDQGPQLQLGFE